MKYLTLKTIALTAVASITLTACLNNETKTDDPMANLELPAALRGNSEVVAVVNGNKLYKVEFDNYVMSRTGQDFDSLALQAKTQLFDEYIQLEQLSQKAKKDGAGYDSDTVIKLRNIEKNILVQAVFSANDKSNPVSEDDINKQYSEEKANFEQMSFKARHILLETEEAAKDVIAQLKKGVNFEKLAKEKSTGPSGANGGDLGWFTADRMVAPFSAATAALEVGKFSEEPVETQFGYHVILKEEEKKAEPPPLETIRPRLEQQIKQARIQAILDDAKANSTVEKLLVIEEEAPVEVEPTPIESVAEEKSEKRSEEPATE